jgi:peptidyl-prolyl cis-trans isomerase B (cyclophilin B)
MASDSSTPGPDAVLADSLERKVQKLQMMQQTRLDLTSLVSNSKQTGTRHRRPLAKRWVAWVLLLHYAVSLVSLAQNRPRPKGAGLPSASTKASPVTTALPSFTAEELKGMQAVLETSAGQIVLEFYPDLAPQHVKYFAGLVKTGFYDGTTFHRVILRGIVQGGDPLSKDPAKKSLYGTGGLRKLKPEFSQQPHVRGTVSAVLLPGDPNSGGSQFFICVSDQRQLDGQYTAWGHVVAGIEVAEKISAMPAGPDQMAKERIEIKKAYLRPIPPPPPIPFADATADMMKRHRVRLVTTLGKIEVEFFPDKAPETVRNFLKLSKAGLFDNTTWHRIVAGFVIQGGDMATRAVPLTADQATRFVKNLQPEFSDMKHEKGSLSMARGDALDSASTSFFICLGPQPTLDRKYTVFGKVVDGLDVVDKIGSLPVSADEKPQERADLIRAEVVEPAP